MREWNAYELKEELDKLWERAEEIAKELLRIEFPESADSYTGSTISYESSYFEIIFEWSYCSCCAPNTEWVIVDLDQIVMTDEELEEWFQQKRDQKAKEDERKKQKEEEKQKKEKEATIEREKQQLERLKAKYES